MTSTLANFCDVVLERVIDMACLDVAMQATAITNAMPDTPEQMADVFRLPRAVITEVVDFTERYSAACLVLRRDAPSIPIPDPWEAHRRASLEKRVSRAIAQIALLAEHKWTLPHRTALVAALNARRTLLHELARSWEQGQRAYHQALQKSKTAKPQALPESLQENQKHPHKARRKNPDKSTKELLQELVGTSEGRQKLLAARTVDGIAAQIGRSHGAVADCPVYKNKIRPMLETDKFHEKKARLDLDDRRLDRRSDRRRK